MSLPEPLEAVLLDVGGVFHLPDHDRIAGAMERAEVVINAAELDRAHYAGVRGLTNFTEGDRSIWLTDSRRRVCTQLGSEISEACAGADSRSARRCIVRDDASESIQHQQFAVRRHQR